jgi:hypothetical protein
MATAEIVLPIRLIGGEHLDVAYEVDGGTPDEIVDLVVSALAEDEWDTGRLAGVVIR